MHLLLLFSLSLLPLAAYVFACCQRSRKSPPLPPGPPRLPWLGNLLNAPPQDLACKTYLHWTRIYDSGLVYMNILGTHVVILNTQETANDLLHKHSRIYSGRPCSHSVSRLLQCDWILACMPFNTRWKDSRRILARHLSSSSASSVVDLQWQRPHVIKYTRHFLCNLLRRPDAFMDHTFKLAASISLSSSYGLDVADDRDQHISIAKKASDVLKFALVPGRFWVDAVPSTVARWIPDRWVERRASKWREVLNQFLDVPFVNANKTTMTSDEMPCILSREVELGVRDEELLKGVLGTVFVGASSTTSAALNVFILAMTCYPQAQKRAQQELDTFLHDRSKSLPTHDDLKDLPYCMAVVYEVLRWHVVGPIGIPHLSTEEDVYLGYRIPKESIVIPNIWAIMRDEREFKENPDEFKPERFLLSPSSLPDVEIDRERMRKVEWVFGFGKRTCVGKWMALNVLKYTICCVLTLFDIEKRKKKKNEGGEEEEEPRIEFESSITSSPLPFVCDIKPRSQEKEDLVVDLGGM